MTTEDKILDVLTQTLTSIEIINRKLEKLEASKEMTDAFQMNLAVSLQDLKRVMENDTIM